MLWLNADAAVAHAQVTALLVLPPANADLPFGGSVFHRVKNQIGEGAAQLGAAAFELAACAVVDADFMVRTARQSDGILLNRQQQQVYRYRLAVGGVVGGF